VVVIAGYVYYTKVHRSVSGDRDPPAQPGNRASRNSPLLKRLLMDDMNQNLIDKLLIDLKSSDENIRERATSQLWRIWFWEKGKIPLEQIEESERLLAEGDIDAAGAIYLILPKLGIVERCGDLLPKSTNGRLPIVREYSSSIPFILVRFTAWVYVMPHWAIIPLPSVHLGRL
jgi:hypothetical protein